jgi:hypothetical protein
MNVIRKYFELQIYPTSISRAPQSRETIPLKKQVYRCDDLIIWKPKHGTVYAEQFEAWANEQLSQYVFITLLM